MQEMIIGTQNHDGTIEHYQLQITAEQFSEVNAGHIDSEIKLTGAAYKKITDAQARKLIKAGTLCMVLDANNGRADLPGFTE
jgi:hypothetical protein